MDTGGKIRTGKILEQLSKHHDITLISNIEYSKDKKYLPQIDTLCSRFIPVAWREIRKYSFTFFVRLFFQMFSIYPVNVLNDYSKPLRKAVEKEVRDGNYDVAVCDFVQSALMFRHISHIPTVLFQHNVESMIAARHIGQSANVVAKLFWWLQWKKMGWFEKKCCHRFQTVIAVSENDKRAFNRLYGAGNIVTIPTGVDVDYFKPQEGVEVKKNSLVFCGSMDWLPNEDAIIYFTREILPEIKKRIPDITLTIVGRNPSPTLKKIVKKYPEVTLTGWVDDIRPFMASSAVYIIPIRIGGGTRMKIYEAMAMGKAIVSTSVGAEGLPVMPGENIFIEDDSLEFVGQIVALLFDQKKRDLTGGKAHRFVNENYGWVAVAEIFSKICINQVYENVVEK